MLHPLRIALGFLAIAALFIGGFLIWQFMVDRALVRDAQRRSIAWAEYSATLLPDIEKLAQGAKPSAHERSMIENLQEFGSIFRFKLFSAEGDLRFASDELSEDHGGLREHNPNAASVIETLRPFTVIKNGRDNPSRPDFYSETYLPVLEQSRVVAIVEVYVDQTETRLALQTEYAVLGAAILTLVLLGSLFPIILFIAILRELRTKNAELEAQRHRAEDADRAKSDFLATMSHEIRTPMNGVLGMANLLAQTSLDDRQSMLNDVIVQSGEQLLRVINDILDFSKVDAGKLVLEEQPLKLSRIVNEPVRLLSRLADDKQLQMLVRIQPDLPSHVVGDLYRLQQVVTNLLSNAIKFTHHGQVFVNLTGELDERASSSTSKVRIEITDTGCGIPADKLEHIFDKFSQIDSSSTRSEEGTGLGLAISKGLVDVMGGSIGASSTLGQGSQFWVELSLTVADGNPVVEAAPIYAKGKRVLSIDDNETNRFIVRELLTVWGMEEASASSAREGLQLLRNAAKQGRPFDAVILDNHMPGMDGGEALTVIREEATTADVAVVLLSSVDPTEHDKIDQALVDSFVMKPAPASELFDAIMNAMSASVLRADVREPQLRPADEVSEEDEAVEFEGVVLLVEDNHVNRLVAKQILAALPVRIIEAHNGADALDMIAAHSPDVVLMDISMPVMDGLEATRRLREQERARQRRRTPILGLTAHAMAGDRARCIEAGMDAYLPKPVDAEKLVEFVRAAVSGSEAA